MTQKYEHESLYDYDPTLEPFKYRINPCLESRYSWLAPLGDLMAKLATQCACCNGIRIVTAAVVGFAIGLLL